MSYHRQDFKDEYPPRGRHHSQAISDYNAGALNYSPVRDTGALRVAHRHNNLRDRRSQAEFYEKETHRPLANQEYFYQEKRPHSRPRSDLYDHDNGYDHKHGHHHGHSRSSKRRHSSSGPNWSQAAVAAASAGIIEAGLARHDRDRATRVLTAAAGAGAIDAVAAKNTEKPHRRWEHVIGSTVGGIVLDRVTHGPRHRH